MKVTKPLEETAPWRIREWFPRLSDEKAEALRLFHVELLRFNQKINLISPSTAERSDQLHFADCMLAAEKIVPQLNSKEVFDLGSGNGFPGLIFAILDTKRRYILVDSDQRKIEFLKYVIDRLSLKNASAVIRRIEELPAGSLNSAICRGWTNIPRALLVSRKLFAKDGQIFHMKGSEWAIEVASIPHQLCSTWNARPAGEYSIPELPDARMIVLTTHA